MSDWRNTRRSEKLDLPVVETSITADVVAEFAQTRKPKYRMVLILAASSGCRIGEILGDRRNRPCRSLNPRLQRMSWLNSLRRGNPSTVWFSSSPRHPDVGLAKYSALRSKTCSMISRRFASYSRPRHEADPGPENNQLAAVR